MAYEYKVFPFKGVIQDGSSVSKVSEQLERILAEFASQGWEFVQLGSVDIEIKPGCLGVFLNSKSTYARYDQIVFRRGK